MFPHLAAMTQKFKTLLKFAKGVGPGAIVEVCGGNFLKSDKKKVIDFLRGQEKDVAFFQSARERGD